MLSETCQKHLSLTHASITGLQKVLRPCISRTDEVCVLTCVGNGGIEVLVRLTRDCHIHTPKASSCASCCPLYKQTWHSSHLASLSRSWGMSVNYDFSRTSRNRSGKVIKIVQCRQNMAGVASRPALSRQILNVFAALIWCTSIQHSWKLSCGLYISKLVKL